VSGSKYAVIERERRFLVPKLPREQPWATRSIEDLYIEGTRVRLRRSDGVVGGRSEVIRKLTQKLSDPDAEGGRRGHITTMYLNETEYERLSVLPGHWLKKERLSFPPMGVDVFQGALAGLLVAEAEFSNDESMAAFVPPPWCGPEITEHLEFTGANLARIAALPPLAARAALAAARLSVEQVP
jgi:CYTH domain-containing protein